MRGGPGGMRPWKEEPPCWRAIDLNPSADQMKRLEVIHQTYIREAQILRAEIWLKFLELRELLTNSSTKVESIRAKNSEINEIQTKLEEKTFESLLKVRNLLSQEQLRRWCPEQEFPPPRRMMQGAGPRGMVPPRRPLFEEGPKSE